MSRQVVFIIRAEITAEDKYGNKIEIDDEMMTTANLEIQQDVKESVSKIIISKKKDGKTFYIRINKFQVIKPKL